MAFFLKTKKVKVRNPLENKKGQVSVEFIIVFVIIIIMFVFFYMLFSNRYLLVQNRISHFPSEEICESLSQTINNIYFSQEGIYSDVFLPVTLKNGYNYSITTTERYLIVEYENRADSCIIAAKNISGTFKNGNYNKITKKGELILIENNN